MIRMQNGGNYGGRRVGANPYDNRIGERTAQMPREGQDWNDAGMYHPRIRQNESAYTPGGSASVGRRPTAASGVHPLNGDNAGSGYGQSNASGLRQSYTGYETGYEDGRYAAPVRVRTQAGNYGAGQGYTREQVSYGGQYAPAAQNTYDSAQNADTRYQDNAASYDDGSRTVSESIETEGDFYASSSREDVYVAPPFTKLRSTLISFVLTLVLATGGFLTAKLNQEAEPEPTATVQTTPTPEASEEPEPSEEAIANVLSVSLNTTTPIFGTSRLQITFEVDADAIARVEILDAAGNVFTVVEDELPVSQGKLRTYFNGYDANGNWITVGSYQVRVSTLKNTAGSTLEILEETDEDYQAALNAQASEEATAEAAAEATQSAEAQDPVTSEDAGTAPVWEVASSMTADFSVNTAPYKTPNSKPAIIATPTPAVVDVPTDTASPEATEVSPTQDQPTQPTQDQPTQPTQDQPTQNQPEEQQPPEGQG